MRILLLQNLAGNLLLRTTEYPDYTEKGIGELNRTARHWHWAGKPLKRLVVALAPPNTALKCGVNERRRGVACPNVVCFDLEPR
jgi:hypothetical protein